MGLINLAWFCYSYITSGTTDTNTEVYFDTVLSIFGKDIVDNIFLLGTFADANEPPVSVV